MEENFAIISGHILKSGCEQIKAENPTNDAIIDDVAGQAYVEQFGLETFQRADRAVQADKVTKLVNESTNIPMRLSTDIITDKQRIPSKRQRPFLS